MISDILTPIDKRQAVLRSKIITAVDLIDRCKYGENQLGMDETAKMVEKAGLLPYELACEYYENAVQWKRDGSDLADAPTEEEQKELENRFKVFWANKSFEKSEPLDFLVDGLITRGSVNLFVGEGGSKKTWTTLDLAVCAALGRDWLNFPVQQTTVLFVDEESGERRLNRRLYETLRGHGVENASEVPIALTSLNMLNLRDTDDVTKLHMLVNQTGAGLVIIDALADVSAGADENSVKDMQPLFMNLRKIAEMTKAAIIVIHHSNRNGGYRGSSALKGAVDLMLMVDSKADTQYINFKTEKARDIDSKSFTSLSHFDILNEKFWLSPTTESDAVPSNISKTQEKIVEFIHKNGSSAIPDITKCTEIGFSSSTIKSACYQLITDGYVARINEGGHGKTSIVDLTEKGKELINKIILKRNDGQFEMPDFVKER
jgi:DNA-binding MarR family transcriptional regulator